MKIVFVDGINRKAQILDGKQITPTIYKDEWGHSNTRIFDLLIVEDGIAIYLERTQ